MPRDARPVERPQATTVVAHTAQLTLTAGPLPSPEMLAQYDAVVPGAAERILVMAERQADHRMSLEAQTVQGEQRRSAWGLAAGFILTLVVLGCSFFLVLKGHEWPGSSLAGLNIVVLAGLFVHGHRIRRDERQDRVKALTRGNQPSS